MFTSTVKIISSTQLIIKRTLGEVSTFYVKVQSVSFNAKRKKYFMGVSVRI